MPVGDILVRDTRSDIEHDDAALSVDVIAIAKSTKFLLSSRVPDIKDDRADVLKEH